MANLKSQISNGEVSDRTAPCYSNSDSGASAGATSRGLSSMARVQLETELAPEPAIVAILAVSCCTQNPEPQAGLFAPTNLCADLFDRESSNTLLSRNKYHIKYAETRFVKISTSGKL